MELIFFNWNNYLDSILFQLELHLFFEKLIVYLNFFEKILFKPINFRNYLFIYSK